jgi:hypothetical protein
VVEVGLLILEELRTLNQAVVGLYDIRRAEVCPGSPLHYIYSPTWRSNTLMFALPLLADAFLIIH